MVNLDEYLQPQLTQTEQQIQAIHAPAYVAMSNIDCLSPGNRALSGLSAI